MSVVIDEVRGSRLIESLEQIVEATHLRKNTFSCRHFEVASAKSQCGFSHAKIWMALQEPGVFQETLISIHVLQETHVGRVFQTDGDSIELTGFLNPLLQTRSALIPDQYLIKIKLPLMFRVAL